MKRKITVSQVIGILLIMVGAALCVGTKMQKDHRSGNVENIVWQIEQMLPNRSNGIEDYAMDSQMPIYEIGDEDFIGLLEAPAYQIKLPVASEWERKILSSYPCRLYGSVYDGSLIIGGVDSRGQFDFLSKLELEEEILVVDMSGAEFGYCVKRIDRAKDVSAEKLYDVEYPLTLYVRDSKSFKYIIVRCVSKWK